MRCIHFIFRLIKISLLWRSFDHSWKTASRQHGVELTATATIGISYIYIRQEDKAELCLKSITQQNPLSLSLSLSLSDAAVAFAEQKRLYMQPTM